MCVRAIPINQNIFYQQTEFAVLDSSLEISLNQTLISKILRSFLLTLWKLLMAFHGVCNLFHPQMCQLPTHLYYFLHNSQTKNYLS